MTNLTITTNKAKQILSNAYKLDNTATFADKNNVNGSFLNAEAYKRMITISSNYFSEYTLIEKCILPEIIGAKTTVSKLNKQCSFARVYLNPETLRLSFEQFASVNSYAIDEYNMIHVMHFKSYKGQLTIALLKEAIVEALSEYLNR